MLIHDALCPVASYLLLYVKVSAAYSALRKRALEIEVVASSSDGEYVRDVENQDVGDTSADIDVGGTSSEDGEVTAASFSESAAIVETSTIDSANNSSALAEANNYDHFIVRTKQEVHAPFKERAYEPWKDLATHEAAHSIRFRVRNSCLALVSIKQVSVYASS